jgi:hypothetical protein
MLLADTLSLYQDPFLPLEEVTSISVSRGRICFCLLLWSTIRLKGSPPKRRFGCELVLPVPYVDEFSTKERTETYLRQNLDAWVDILMMREEDGHPNWMDESEIRAFWLPIDFHSFRVFPLPR